MGSIVLRRLAAFVLAVITGLVVLAAVLIVFIWLFQERVAYQPQRPPYPAPGRMQRLDYFAADGQPLIAYLVGEGDPPAGILLVFHGNADLAVRHQDWATEIVRRTGVSVLLAEYRGYMGLPGRPTYDGLRLDAEAAYRIARESLGIPPETIAFFGHSLGTAVAAELALRHTPAALLLQAPFTSARAMARLSSWRVVDPVWKLIARLHYDTRSAVARIDTPVWVAHGLRDRIIPARMGQQLFAAAQRKGELLLIPDASHNDIESVGGAVYWEWITGALMSIRPAKSAVPETREGPSLTRPSSTRQLQR